MLIKKTLGEYIELAASESPTPGGGSVAALAGSLGAALTNMVGNLSFGKESYESLDEDIRLDFEKSFARMVEIREELKVIVDEDSQAFDGVMEAFKLPKETDQEKLVRSAAIQSGYMKALEVPYECGKLCLEALELQEVFAHYGNINAITDVGMGALLAYTGIEGAFLNVEINLASIKDEDFKEKKYKEIKEELEKAKKIRDKTMEIVYSRLG